MALIDHFLAEQRMCFPMSQISGGESISLAISWLYWNSAQSILITARGFCKSNLRQRLYGSCRSGTSWSEKPEVPDETPGRSQAGQVHLVNTYDLVNRFILANNQTAELVLQLLRLFPAVFGFNNLGRSTFLLSVIGFRRPRARRVP
jgi:hypothetical protein